jgi:hypothetical protein
LRHKLKLDIWDNKYYVDMELMFQQDKIGIYVVLTLVWLLKVQFKHK